MAFALDPQVAAAMAPLLAAAGDAIPPPAGDWKTRRANVEGLMDVLATLQPAITDVTMTNFVTTADDGTTIALRWYTKDGGPADAAPGSAVLYIHGGGMILGSMALYDPTVSRLVSATGVPMLSVDYRLAPEYPHPVPVEDSYAGLRWLAAHAGELGVDPTRIAVMGDSAGGGLAAGVAIAARDRGGPAVTRQILIYPMLDDRNTTLDPLLAPVAAWSYEDNITGWNALLGAGHEGAAVDPTASPARLTDANGLPPTYLEVGQLDIFRDEALRYALTLSGDGVPVELHLHSGVPHEYDAIAFDTGVARRAQADRHRVLRSL